MNRENGLNFPIFEDMEKNVTKVGVYIIATPDVLRKTKELGVEAIYLESGEVYN